MSASRRMFRLRTVAVALGLALGCVAAADAQVSFGFTVPGGNIGFSLNTYPQLAPVPGYPVYYAPNLDANYFFYDGMYWLYANDSWYASSWYNGPWQLVAPDTVPVYLLRVPVRYYHRPPPYFRGWAANAAPRWDQHWGASWADHHRGWDRWDHRNVPARAPLPTYQRQFAGNRYPPAERQHEYAARNYHYQPRDEAVRQRFGGQHGGRAEGYGGGEARGHAGNGGERGRPGDGHEHRGHGEPGG